LAHVHYLKGERCALRCVLGNEGYSAIVASGKAGSASRITRVAARQEARESLLIDR